MLITTHVLLNIIYSSKEKGKLCQANIMLSVVWGWKVEGVDDSLIPGSPDEHHAGQEAEEGGEGGGHHGRVVRRAVVTEEHEGQHQAGIGKT